jgi:hypothetical protein
MKYYTDYPGNDITTVYACIDNCSSYNAGHCESGCVGNSYVPDQGPAQNNWFLKSTLLMPNSYPSLKFEVDSATLGA